MKIERTKNATKNISVGFGIKIYQMAVPFLMRTAMIHCLGVQYLGLNSLFASVLQILNLAELGVGSAMVFSMYRPIAEDDAQTINALMRLYRRYYRLIGLVIGVAGLLLTPMIPELIYDKVPEDMNVYILYLLNLAATVMSYWLFAYKNSLLQAHQRTDVVSLVGLLTSTLQYLFQLIVLFYIKNYYWYVCVTLGAQILNNVTTAMIVTKMYPEYRPVGVLPKEKVRDINQRIRDLFTGKLGAVILKSVDTVVISAFLGLTTLAIYQNYYYILTCIIGLIEIIFSSIMAGLGNSFLTETRQKNFQDLKKFSFLFMWLTGWCTCCFLCLYQPFMRIWVGESLMLNYTAVVIFGLYFFVYTLNRLLNVYKDAAGLWHEDRFRPLITALVNLVLNLLWVRRWGIYGVLLSTVVSMVVVGMPWLLHNIFTLFFEWSQLKAYLKEIFAFVGAAIFAGAVSVLLCSQIRLGPWATFVCCGVVCVSVPNILFYMLFRKNSLFARSVCFVDQITKGKLQLRKYLLRYLNTRDSV